MPLFPSQHATSWYIVQRLFGFNFYFVFCMLQSTEAMRMGQEHLVIIVLL